MSSSSAPMGREGKGKIVDWLSDRLTSSCASRGPQCRHTLVINGETYKLALLPSGVLRPSKLAVIGTASWSIRRRSSMKSRNASQGVAISPTICRR